MIPIYAKTKENFINKLNNGEVDDSFIVFIEDTKEIWTHGNYFPDNISGIKLNGITYTNIDEEGVLDLGTIGIDESVLEGYLPLSGGNLKGQLVINPSGAQGTFVVYNADDTYRLTHVWDGNTARLYNSTNDGQSYGILSLQGTIQINGYTPITSSNIGSQSVNYATGAGNASTVGGIPISSVTVNNNSSGYWGNLGYGSFKKIAIGSNFGGVGWNAEDYSAGLMFGCELDTHGFISMGYTNPIVSFAGSNNSNASADSPKWYWKLKGTSGTTYDLNCAPAATKLATARTIWGQSFDGTKNVSGSLYMPNATDIIFKSTSGENLAVLGVMSSNYLAIGYTVAEKGFGTYLYGSPIYFCYKSSAIGMVLNTSGDVGIGTTSPAYKLDVAGTGRFTGAVTMLSTLTMPSNTYATGVGSGGAIVMSNSDIVGCNAIWFGDAADSQYEGINFVRGNGNIDNLNAYDGTLYFSTNRASTGVTAVMRDYAVLHSGNSSVSLSGSTLTVKINGTSYSLTNTNTTYSAGSGISLSGTTFNHADTSSLSGSYGPTANVSGSNGATIVVPQITVDGYGHVTAVTNRTYTSVNTDTNTTYSAGSGLSLSGTTFNHASSVTAGTAGTSSATSGSTLAVPYVTVNATGHVTGYGTHTHTISGFSTTDTKNTAGSTNSTSRLFLIGATSQAANPETYSNSGVYATAGTMYATAFYETSDAKLKNFEGDIEIDFEKLKTIPKKYFTWKEGDGVLQLGTSAQAVQKVYPEIVTEDDKLHLDYSKLSIVALAAIDKLYEENKELKERIIKLEEIVYGNRN